MNSVRLINQSLKNQKSTLTGCKDIGIRKSDFVAKTHFLFIIVWYYFKKLFNLFIPGNKNLKLYTIKFYVGPPVYTMRFSTFCVVELIYAEKYA